MKRIMKLIALISILTMCVAFITGCGNDKKSEEKDTITIENKTDLNIESVKVSDKDHKDAKELVKDLAGGATGKIDKKDMLDGKELMLQIKVKDSEDKYTVSEPELKEATKLELAKDGDKIVLNVYKDKDKKSYDVKVEKAESQAPAEEQPAETQTQESQATEPEPQPAEPAPVPEPAPAQQEPAQDSQQSSGGGSSDGCLNDALFN